MQRISCSRLTLFAIAGAFVQIIGLSLFVFGFFPVKPALSGFSGPESFSVPVCDYVENENDPFLPPDQLRLLYQDLYGVPPLFDRLVFMVIDGLPAEFVLGKDGKPPDEVVMGAMPYTQSLLASGLAIGYHAKAAPPTVTMPRLKAMVSGAIGGFLDVAFNFNTQALLDDNLIDKFCRIGWKMVMLGDETWLKLFPGKFTRHDGVSSFFKSLFSSYRVTLQLPIVSSLYQFNLSTLEYPRILLELYACWYLLMHEFRIHWNLFLLGVCLTRVKDTVHVDHNVSRHLGNELSSDDWNLLILHYLGLDHVGHVGGRNSALMPPKLTEMDEVIKRIHSSIFQSKEKDGGRTLLMVVSDHGMTKSGNHGGSSDEETDSLILLIGISNHISGYESASHNAASQVDVAPTLALLFGVPIPTNNVGVLISAAFDTLEDQHRLRVLQLNSWQLLRLLQAQLPALPCRDFPCDGFGEHQISDSSYCNQSSERMLCCLYVKATLLHASWKSKNNSDVSRKEDYRSAAASYNRFLRSASEWLSRRTTDKPVNLLAAGVATMSLSCLIFFILILHVRDVYLDLRPQGSKSGSMDRWSPEEVFILCIIFIIVASMGSSSMVEEEHYIWHFMMSTFYLLLLRKTAKSFARGTQCNLIKRENMDSYFQLSLIFLLLISERILRGWHQGGVNWVHLPDISKWLEQTGGVIINSLQLISALLVMGFGLSTQFLTECRGKLLMVRLSFSICGLLVLLHILKYQDDTFVSSSYGATLLAQTIYTILGASTFGTAILLPWFISSSVCKTSTNKEILSQHSVSEFTRKEFSVAELRDSLHVIGLAYTICWSFLQLLLQQPKNSALILLIFVQIYASVLYFSRAGSEKYHQEWKEVAALYYLGMAGHFALGNSNTLATIDVAGAFIGMSSHSTLLSGILMFAITYASPMFVLLSLVLYISTKITDNPAYLKNADDGTILLRILGYTCLVPLGLNSVLLTAYTVVLVLMRNHLFVWSVFSPKYLYVCAATVCTYVGVSIVAATGIYTYSVLVLRRRMSFSKSSKLR